MNQEKYIGMDVHDATISAAVKNAEGKLLMECVLETMRSLFKGPGSFGFNLVPANDSSFRFCLVGPPYGQMVAINSCRNTNVSPEAGKLVISF